MDLTEFPDRYDEPDPDTEGVRAPASGYLRSEDHAAWAARIHRDITMRRLEVARTAAEEITRIKAWAEAEDASLIGRQEWFAAILEDYARRARALDPTRTKVTTPYGVVKTRTIPPNFTVDLDAAFRWAQGDPRTAKLIHKTTEEKVLKSELVRVLTVKGGQVFDKFTGEVIEWATPVPESLKVDVIPDLPGPTT